jgi:hypothetical protein
MKIITRIMLMLLLSVVMLIDGCGNKESKNEGCPTDSFLANAGDSISGPADATFTGNSYVGSPFPGGSFLYAPLQFTVTDSGGVPRNKVCLILYTDGFWYTNNTYTGIITGIGPMNAVVAVTNDFGNAILYWSTELLPPGIPAAGGTAGADQTGESWIQAYSGTITKTYNVNWTVKGEPIP